jgi:putative methyltransferase (TIGR04325 family)
VACALQCLAAVTTQIASTVVRRLKDLAWVRRLREERYERVFASSAGFGHCRGVFETFAEALRSAPKGAPLGFDHEQFAGDFGERFATILPHDYPVLFWLRRWLVPGGKVFDLGGYTGSQFHAYRPYLDNPGSLDWTVCDVPKVVERGRELAKERGYRRLRFTDCAEDAEGSDVLLAAGSLQYIESPSLPRLLEGMKTRPRHLLLNKLPLYDGPAFVTLQNGGPVFVAQHVFNRAALLNQLARLGYRLADSWDVPGFSTEIPFQPRRRVPTFTGLYLTACYPAERSLNVEGRDGDARVGAASV